MSDHDAKSKLSAQITLRAPSKAPEPPDRVIVETVDGEEHEYVPAAEVERLRESDNQARIGWNEALTENVALRAEVERLTTLNAEDRAARKAEVERLRERARTNRAAYRAARAEVLGLLSDEAIERAAQAQYAVEASVMEPTWDQQNSLVQDNYRRSVRAAITAALEGGEQS